MNWKPGKFLKGITEKKSDGEILRNYDQIIYNTVSKKLILRNRDVRDPITNTIRATILENIDEIDMGEHMYMNVGYSSEFNELVYDVRKEYFDAMVDESTGKRILLVAREGHLDE